MRTSSSRNTAKALATAIGSNRVTFSSAGEVRKLAEAIDPYFRVAVYLASYSPCPSRLMIQILSPLVNAIRLPSGEYLACAKKGL